MKKYMLLSLFTLCTLIACDKDDDSDPEMEELDCDTFNDSYTSAIKSIIDQNCATAGCHAGGNQLPDFTEYANVFAGRTFIKSRVVGKTMPPAGKTPLSQSMIDQIDCWVQNGAPE